MATECSQEAVLQFLTDRGGIVKNLELIDYFKCIFPSDPEKKAVIRESFKGYVDNIAFVKIENGVKFVCLKKKYRGSVKRVEKDTCKGMDAGATVSEQVKTAENECSIHVGLISNSEAPEIPDLKGMDLSCGQVGRSENRPTAVNEVAQQEIPGSGYRAAGKAKLPDVPDIVLQSITSKGVPRSARQPFVKNNAFDMGNLIGKTCEEKIRGDSEEDIRTDSGIPRIALISASPLPAEADGAMFILPEQSGMDTLGQAGALGLPAKQYYNKCDSESISLGISQGCKEANFGRADLVTRRRTSRESQRSLASSHLSEEGDGQSDSQSMSGSESNTPKGSRKNFIELMINSSPQVRRSMALRDSVLISARHRDSVASDSDSASLMSYDEGAAVTLDPLEHAWMMCSADAEWEGLHQLLACEPNLILKKDFVTGFTCLHWAAKKGKPELLAMIVNFAKQQAVPLNINSRSSAGYTPLHMAAMHNHLDVMKLLIGAYNADVEVRDYSGKKACQYLHGSATRDIRDIIGALGDTESTDHHVDGVRWRLSKVLHSKLLHHHEADSGDGAARPKVLRRKSSLSKMKPRLQNIRHKAQIVHSTSFRDGQEMEESLGSSLKSRPNSSLLG